MTDHHRAASLPVGEVALAIALSVVLGQLRLLQLPLGGSVTLAALPIILLALTRGPGPAVWAGFGAGIGHAVTGGIVIHPAQYLLDYGLAWAALALVGVLVARGMGLRTALVITAAVHLAVFVTSGAIFFAQYAGDLPVLWYSLAYNATHVIPAFILVMVALPAALRAWHRAAPPMSVPPAG